MTSKKTILAIPLMAIAVIAIGFGMTSNVFAQTGLDTVEKNSAEGHESSDSASDKDNLQQ